MLHSLDIVVNDTMVEPKQPEEISQKFVSLSDLMGQALACRGQNKSPIFFIFQQPLSIQSLDHVCHAGLGNLECGCDVNHAGVSL